jgi:hypothetical protein
MWEDVFIKGLQIRLEHREAESICCCVGSPYPTAYPNNRRVRHDRNLFGGPVDYRCHLIVRKISLKKAVRALRMFVYGSRDECGVVAKERTYDWEWPGHSIPRDCRVGGWVGGGVGIKSGGRGGFCKVIRFGRAGVFEDHCDTIGKGVTVFKQLGPSEIYCRSQIQVECEMSMSFGFQFQA